jgi:response regulator RpfG family c-di-GMP phosphodiesterase
MTAKEDLLRGKKILIVDDEPDVLNTLEDLLPMCNVVRAENFEDAKGLLVTLPFDMAVLDIMGVDGYELLDIAVGKKVTTVMFTAHAVSPEDTMKSFKGGAAYYVPKDRMAEMPEILANIFEAKELGRSTWAPFMDWAEAYYSMRIGARWEEYRREFKEKLK